jgi:HSP20 family molecular chaperone IbpA
MILFPRRKRSTNISRVPVAVETGPSRELGTHDVTFTVPIGLGETRDALHLRIVVPAVKREDLRLRIDGQMLRLSGERRPPADFCDDGRCHFALTYGVFAQDVLLPDGLDVRRMHAQLHEGVLDVRIPFAGDAHSAFSIGTMAVVPDFRPLLSRAKRAEGKGNDVPGTPVVRVNGTYGEAQLVGGGLRRLTVR